jgi:hypothetical protein
MRCPQKTAISGSVEILERNKQSLLGAPAHRASAPAARASPHIVITSHKVNQIAEGGQGDTPLGLPPPLGERGGHLHIFLSQRKDEQNQVFYRAELLRIGNECV